MRNSATQSHLRYPLTRLLGNGGHVRVLRALLAFGAPLSATQLAGDSGLTPQGTRLVLDSLVSQGVVAVLGQPRSQVFALAARHPLAAALTALFEQERSRWDGLQRALRDRLAGLEAVRSAWLYGSVARAEDEPRSDIDIALVLAKSTAAAADKARQALQDLGDRLFVHFSVVALSPADVARLSAGDPWWLQMSRDAKVLKGVSPQQEAARRTRSPRGA